MRERTRVEEPTEFFIESVQRFTLRPSVVIKKNNSDYYAGISPLLVAEVNTNSKRILLELLCSTI